MDTLDDIIGAFSTVLPVTHKITSQASIDWS